MLWVAHVFIKYIIFNAHPKSFFMALNGLFQSLCCQHPKNELLLCLVVGLLMLLCTWLSACFYVLLLIMKHKAAKAVEEGEEFHLTPTCRTICSKLQLL